MRRPRAPTEVERSSTTLALRIFLLNPFLVLPIATCLFFVDILDAAAGRGPLRTAELLSALRVKMPLLSNDRFAQVLAGSRHGGARRIGVAGLGVARAGHLFAVDVAAR